MAKYKLYSNAQGQFIPVFFDKQIQKGTFEYTLSYLVDSELDLSIFDQRFCNDETGAPSVKKTALSMKKLYRHDAWSINSHPLLQNHRRPGFLSQRYPLHSS